MATTADLTPRERQVLDGILAGKTYPQIAFAMGLGHETVKTYANRLRAKTGTRSKVGLVLWATDTGKRQPCST